MKKKMILLTILTLLVLLGSFILFHRLQAKKAIYDYIAKQGIQESQLKYIDFHKDLKFGGYWMAVYVEGENPDIHYEYFYKDKKVNFQAYLNSEKAIKNKQWGGSGLSDTEMKKLKYPPLQ
ncbi:DUF3139 domain-containing protein [Bacillus cytotoxicus]|uniref:Secreted protein n=3 Tax=Bacillus TaxID=1386 RepID=A0AAX2CI76_9BACI|nr:MULTISPECIES: DUF3139 domain-containing protein [Bacillus cereus group]ABS22538.1 putative secreted protein [Bacillus cytotoxicus NVH 391-98]MDH2862568.1 DUF3139 domain-containing protein [Bacillus cytotoxicus]MDH2865761.1 DUF3139 domain-containing protein [Bacillus cytotoxicus]MDH2870533.1 DUF3139 domain-containing protein [Bacillus cytotoxicus]MDH2874504.1 DUF3139 domain-containing protein [Bacillus cytotoxicus]